MGAQQIEILIFRYIGKDKTETFISQMKEWNITLKPPPAARPGEWSYPDYEEYPSINLTQLTDQVLNSMPSI